MRTAVTALMFMLCHAVAFAQRPVMFEQLTSTGIGAAVASGKTTLVVVAGGVHENTYAFAKPQEFTGPDKDTTAVSKHNIAAHYLARRIAEDLGNALALVITQTPNPAHI